MFRLEFVFAIYFLHSGGGPAVGVRRGVGSLAMIAGARAAVLAVSNWWLCRADPPGIFYWGPWSAACYFQGGRRNLYPGKKKNGLARRVAVLTGGWQQLCGAGERPVAVSGMGGDGLGRLLVRRRVLAVGVGWRVPLYAGRCCTYGGRCTPAQPDRSIAGAGVEKTVLRTTNTRYGIAVLPARVGRPGRSGLVAGSRAATPALGSRTDSCGGGVGGGGRVEWHHFARRLGLTWGGKSRVELEKGRASSGHAWGAADIPSSPGIELGTGYLGQRAAT